MIDLAFINGAVYTMDKNNPKAEALAVKGQRIVAVGSSDEIINMKGRQTEVIDLKGKMLLPGFIDAHCHPSLCAFFAAGIFIDEDMSIEEALKTIGNYIEKRPERPSYFGIGYSECLFDEKGPKKEMLDAICKDKPIFILGSSGHEGWCNTKTLELAKVTKETPDPVPGFQYFERDEEGNPTGHVVECGAETILFDGVEFFQDEEINQGYKETSESYSQMGVTTLVDCGAFEWMEKKSIPVFEELINAGVFKQRVFGSIIVDAVSRKQKAFDILTECRKVYNSDQYRMDTYKVILDGTMETRTASLSEPYNEDGRIIEPMMSGREIEDLFVTVAKAGFDIHAHGIGDKAIGESLRGAAAVRAAGFHDTRITNAHTSYVAEEDKALFGKYNLIANTTGVWHYGNSDLDKIIGHRAQKQYTLKDIIDKGGVMTLGSDRPVDEYGPEPLKSIEIAMTRKLVDHDRAPVLEPADQTLDLQTCLEAYTCNGAFQVHMEEKLGKLAPGLYADLVVLGQDLFHVPVEKIHTVPVEMTVWNGKIVYKEGEV